MKKLLSLLLSLAFLAAPILSSAQATVPQGGTGTTTFPKNWVVLGNSSLRLTAAATSTLKILTDDLVEGASNLFYSDARVGSYISGSSTIPHVGNLSNGNVLVWNGSAWTAVATSTLKVLSSDVLEGATNLFFTNSRVDDRINASTTIAAPGGATSGYVPMWNGSRWIASATATCVAITGSAGLCDGSDATGAGGSGSVSTSTADTDTHITYFTSTNATPALIGGEAAFTYNDDTNLLTFPNASGTQLTVSGSAYLLGAETSLGASSELRPFASYTNGWLASGVHSISGDETSPLTFNSRTLTNNVEVYRFNVRNESGDTIPVMHFFNTSGAVGIGTTSVSANHKLAVAWGIITGHITATSTATSSIGTLSVPGIFYDGTGTGGNSGSLLKSTGTGVAWTATSSLNINHTDLRSLAFTSSGHTGTAFRLFGTDASGAAAEYATSSLKILTSDLIESGSLFYTDARVNAVINASTTIAAPGGATSGFVPMWNGSRWIASATATCVAITGSADLCDGNDGGAGASEWTDGGFFDYDLEEVYVGTSTVIVNRPLFAVATSTELFTVSSTTGNVSVARALSANVLTLTTPLAASSGGTGLSSLGTGVATWLGTPSSANLDSAVTDDTGSGALVFADSPTLTTPTLGAASATTIDTGHGANEVYVVGDGLAVSTNDLIFDCSDVASTGLQCSGEDLQLNATGDWTGTVDGNNFAGGAVATGDILYGSGAGAISELGIGSFGEVLSVSGGLPDWIATSTLKINHADLINNLFTASGHTGTAFRLFGTNASGAATEYATSSLKILTSDLIESGSLFYTDARVNTLINASTTIAAPGGASQGFVPMWNGSRWIASATATCAAITGSADLCDGDDATGGAGSTPGGANEAIQYRNGSSFAGAPDFVFASTTNLVGIGTTSPYAKLSVHAKHADALADLFVVSTSTLTATTSVFKVDRQGFITFSPSIEVSSGNTALGWVADSVSSFNGDTSGPFTFGTRNVTQDAEAFRFSVRDNAGSTYQSLSLRNNSGAVGIGTTTPFAHLSVHAVGNKANTSNNIPLFAIATSTLTSTTTVLLVDTVGDLHLGLAGVKLSQDGDGALTILGEGDGNDESVTFNFDDTANTLTLSSGTGLNIIDFGSIGADLGAATLEIPNGTGPTANDPGEIAHDTTADDQLIVDDFIVPLGNQKIWSVTVASTSPAFISAGLLKVPTEIDGYTMTAIRCSVQGGTSKIIAVEDESANSTEDITCATSVTSDDGTITNAAATAGEEMYIDFGATSGTVDYVSISVFGSWTRE